MKKVITYGSFDLFHEGHYKLLKRAKELGDYLIVGVTTEHFDLQRGKLNVVDSLLERIDNVKKTGFADEIIIEDHEGQKEEDIKKYDIDIFTLGSDWTGVFDYLGILCKVIYLERTPDISSTMLRKSKFPIIRLGIVGTGRIAPRFIAEAKYVSGIHVRSVYNPHGINAKIFGEKYEMEYYSADYWEFIHSIDAIYIASIHETHFEYAKQALNHGKHVLCEKPLAFSKAQAEELYKIANENGLILMEGIKTAYCPGFAEMINVAKSGVIGEVKDVEACFSRLTDPQLREMVDQEYGGAFLEFGSYTLLPIFKLLGCDFKEIKIDSILADNGVDLYTKIYFNYNNSLGLSKTGVGVKSEGQLIIAGTKGYILAPSPWWLTKSFEVRYENPNKVDKYSPKFMGDGLRYEISEFISRINGHGKQTFRLTQEESIAMAEIVEKFMEQRRQEN
ncbi:Gfo/Idh/MocA family oxidoreductase [Anaerocolumna xylanovorans]|uniref:Glycerol-3-phosphate cytidylyltransferase n=1 Tax=Anaerocolumna xylanovorans DSM 12503 TaxID=1121345 RepID=A0A1M7Y823_9FIRM|nr:Gfo/Idh/MocA family oxidoreductase [Anaerocolumna xylanovorans]SHO48769.1 glycerol-3-phosphate cytidylyltransferase [Anaerocolumna xylanovorans DSM 12503]